MCYTHLTVNHSQTFKDLLTGVHMNTTDGLWRLIISEFYSKKKSKYLVFHTLQNVGDEKITTRKQKQLAAFIEAI